MRVIAKSRLRHYWQMKPYRTAEQPLRAWYDEISKGEWTSFNDLKKEYPSVSIVGNGRVVFNICRNSFRLVVKFEFRMNAVFIRFFGTHKKYYQIDASEV
jgi:mRNA interferase HigB